MSAVYPNDLPVAEALELVGFIRTGTAMANKKKFAYNVWLLQGFAQKSLVGDPFAAESEAPTGGVVLTPSSVPADFNVADELEKLCVSYQADAQAQLTVPWKQILQWALTELTTIVLAA